MKDLIHSLVHSIYLGPSTLINYLYTFILSFSFFRIIFYFINTSYALFIYIIWTILLYSLNAFNISLSNNKNNDKNNNLNISDSSEGHFLINIYRHLPALPGVSLSNKIEDKSNNQINSINDDNNTDEDDTNNCAPVNKNKLVIPDIEQIVRLFDEFMEEKCFNQQVRVNMRENLTIKQKWTLISQDNSTKYNSTDSDNINNNNLTIHSNNNNNEEENARNYVTHINNIDYVTKQKLIELRIVLSGTGKRFLSSFNNQGGLTALINIIARASKREGVNIEAIRCLKSFMNNEFGLMCVLEYDINNNVYNNKYSPIDCLVFALLYGDQIILIQVVDLLSVLAWVSERGHELVLNSLSAITSLKSKSTSSLFSFLLSSNKQSKPIISPAQLLPAPTYLVRILQKKENFSNITLSTAVFKCLNALINAFSQTEDRVRIRTELLNVGLSELLLKYHSLIDYKDRDTFEQYEPLQTQLSLFDSQYSSDRLYSSYNGLDLADLDACFAWLQEATRLDGVTFALVDVIHLLMTVPATNNQNNLNSFKVWDNIVYVLQHIIEISTGNNTDGASINNEITFEKIKSLIQTRDSNRPSPQLFIANNNNSNNAVGQNNLVIGNSIPEAPNMSNNALEAPPMAPPIGSSDIPCAPPMAPDAPPMAPPFGAPNAPPMAPGLSKSAPKVPTKLNKKPEKPVRQLHWSVIPPLEAGIVNEADNGKKGKTVWSGLDDIKLAKSIDINELVNQFAVVNKKKENEKEKEAESNKNELVVVKKEPVELLDSKRAYAINIGLARFRIPLNEIVNALLKFNRALLDEEKTFALFNIVPTQEEIKIVKQYTGPDDELSTSDLFVKAMASVPFISDRVELFLFRLRYDDHVVEIIKSISSLEQALKALRNLPTVTSLLELILLFGNTLNGGTPKGGAFGFKIDILTKLKNTKSSEDPSITLLHFIVQTMNRSPLFKSSTTSANVNESKSQVKAFVDSLSSIHEASKVDLSQLGGDISKTKALLEKCDNIIKKSPRTANDLFFSEMEPFTTSNLKAINDLYTRYNKMLSSCDEAIEWFSEDKSVCSINQILNIFSQFIFELKEAEELIDRRAEEKLKMEKLKLYQEAEKLKRINKNNNKNEQNDNSKNNSSSNSLKVSTSTLVIPPGDNDKAIVDNVMNSLSSNNSVELLNAINQRRKINTPRTNNMSMTKSAFNFSLKKVDVNTSKVSGSTIPENQVGAIASSSLSQSKLFNKLAAQAEAKQN